MIDLNPEILLEVKNILNQQIPDITVWVFGSRVTGQAKAYSDLDLALITDKPLTGKRLRSLKNAFSESDIPILVDVVDWSEISDEFREIIKTNYEVAQEQTKSLRFASGKSA